MNFQKSNLLFFSIVITLLFSGCQVWIPVYQYTSPKEELSSCHIIYDAGSSGTRLYIFQQQETNWLEHAGPKVEALADPIRGIRGKGEQDIDPVTTAVVTALDQIKTDGPDKDGKPKWQAFDWSTQCKVLSAKVYATAGMRLAEQENRTGSEKLWNLLKQKLTAKVGDSVKVETRTISGYEEGLYAWRAIKKNQKDNNFGIVEMGGASSQITFPCSECDDSNNSTKTIIVEGTPLKIYSYSFLGLGQDEAPKTLPENGILPTSCSYGIGEKDPDWKEPTCAVKIPIQTSEGIRDPYNFKGDEYGTYNRIPRNRADVSQWFLTGAFNYAKDSDIETCCLTRGECYEEQTSCFRPVYLKKYLQVLAIPANSQAKDTSWTEGAVLCEQENCLQTATPPPICRWSDQGCL